MVRSYGMPTRNFIIPINGILSYLFQEVTCERNSDDIIPNSDSNNEVRWIEDKIFNAMLRGEKEISIPKTEVNIQKLLKTAKHTVLFLMCRSQKVNTKKGRQNDTHDTTHK